MESSFVCSFFLFLFDKSKCIILFYFLNENSLVYVKNCRRNIKNYFKLCNIGDIVFEGYLICYCVGVFLLFGDYIICLFYWYFFGIWWKKKLFCLYLSYSIMVKVEVGRSIILFMFWYFYIVYGYIVFSGLGIYMYCICVVKVVYIMWMNRFFKYVKNVDILIYIILRIG